MKVSPHPAPRTRQHFCFQSEGLDGKFCEGFPDFLCGCWHGSYLCGVVLLLLLLEVFDHKSDTCLFVGELIWILIRRLWGRTYLYLPSMSNRRRMGISPL
ncbi:MAG: hypothetical protein F6K41_41665 [Symploca sp. SIO3E6]|nr:hypothetical protein [Caldora sp. SIO3E6]